MGAVPVRMSRILSITNFLEAYGFGGFRISGMIKNECEFWTISRAGGGEVCSFFLPLDPSGFGQPAREVAMSMIWRIEEWKKALYE